MDDDISNLNEHTETILSHQPKRRKTFHHNLPNSRHDQYTVGWICALHIEMAAARAMLDEIRESLPKHVDDSNTYVLGTIMQHNVVIACLPDGQYGTNNAAIVATNMLRTFRRIRVCLMVGIGGGVPSRADLRLGDVVVGTRVMQCDLGKVIEDGRLLRTAVPRIPHPSLGTVVSALRSKHELSPSQVPTILQQKLAGQTAYSRPNMPDRLFHATYNHESATHGSSGNQVMRSGTTRDDVARKLDVICFEMETAGLIDILPCLPIRGICDYSDSHKSKEWQRYAAATAAAYARELLEELPVTDTHASNTCIYDSVDRHPSDNRRRHLLDSLRFEQIDHRKMDIKKALTKTCQWLLSHPSYEEWLDPARLTQHHGFLWISGKPGAGKSTMMKFAYGRMRTKARSKNAVTASFFFNARGEHLEKSIAGMYRSLLLQLLEGYPDLQTVLDDPELVPYSVKGCPPLNSLKDLFYSAISKLGQRKFTCFVDALDECDEQQVVDMVQFFEDLTEQYSAMGVPFRICFSSRHYPYINIRQGIRLTLEDQPGHTKDLEIYVADRLRIDNPLFAEELRVQLLDKAAGVFMKSRRGGMFLKKRLAEIPSDLSELFKEILRRDREDMEALLFCILWILYAKRPLRPKEIYHALWCGLSLDSVVDGRLPDVTLPDSNADLNRFDRYVIHSSKGRAEVTKSETVQFIHESVRDFLIKDKGLHDIWPEIGFDSESPGHEKLKQCCYLYMSHFLSGASLSALSVLTPGLQKETLDKFPFLEYTGQYVFYHANIAAKERRQDGFLSSFPLSDWIKIRNAFERYLIRRCTQEASLAYIFADSGHSELVRGRPREELQSYSPQERYKYPLFAALASGNKDTVAAVLDLPSFLYRGVDITEGLAVRKDFKECEGRTPLSWAAQEGCEVIAQRLLQNGVSIDEMDQAGCTPLLRASQNGHEAVVRLLIERGADVNDRNTDGQTPLLLALENGNEAVLRFLIKKGADVNARDSSGWTPLFRVPRTGNEAMARLLIDNGAEVNASDSSGVTPLSHALLIKKGAEVNTSDEYGETPLLKASRQGQEAVARLLIENGGEASRNRHEAVVRLLIKKGAEVNASDEDGKTPLLWASRNRHKAVAELLIEAGAKTGADDR
ncbi:hypothetical protein BJX96DRAFT_161480 [Aspergillus floccosus]